MNTKDQTYRVGIYARVSRESSDNMNQYYYFGIIARK